MQLSRDPSVTAPVLLAETRRAYFARTPEVYRGAGGFHDARRRSISLSGRCSCSRQLLRVNGDAVAFLHQRNGPPTAASGETWPTTMPYVPPENRPSVINPTESPSPAPIEGGCRGEHLAHPRAALGPFITDDDHIAGMDPPGEDGFKTTLFSESKTRAGPVMAGCFTPVIFATAPSVARFPRRMARCPWAYRGFSHGRITSCPAGGFEGIVCKHLRNGLSRDRQRISVQDAMVEQHPHDLRDAAGLMELRGDKSSGWLQVAQHRDASSGSSQNHPS